MMRDRKIKQTRLNRKWKDHNARRKRLLQRLRAKMEKEILSGHVHLPAASVSVTLATAHTHTHTHTWYCATTGEDNISLARPRT